MKKNKLLTLSLCVLMGTSAVYAEGDRRSDPNEGIYLRVGAGGSFMPALNGSFVSGSQVIQQTSTFDHGWDADAAMGYRFWTHYRAELSGGYFYNAMKSNYSGTTNGQLQDGHGKAYFAFVNGYYNFETKTKFEPYLGLGVGYVRRRYMWELINSDPANTFDATHASIGFQGLAGLSYYFTPQWAMSLDYHYVAATSYTVRVTSQAGNPASGIYSVNFATSFINLGVSCRF